MLANPPQDPLRAFGHTAFAWPIDILTTVGQPPRFAGFLMPHIAKALPVFCLFNPLLRRRYQPLFDYHRLVWTARNLAAAMEAVHANGYVIGDVNAANILVTDTALLTLIDVDSLQVRDPQTGTLYRCPVGTPEFTPPELHRVCFAQCDRRKEHDLFGLAVLIFQLLMEGTHPFAGRYLGQPNPSQLDARICAGHYPYGRGRQQPYEPMLSAPPIEILDPKLRELFDLCFLHGHHSPGVRPDAKAWKTALSAAASSLVSCGHNPSHRHPAHLPACCWCQRASLGFEAFPSPSAVRQGLHVQRQAVVCPTPPVVQRPVVQAANPGGMLAHPLKGRLPAPVALPRRMRPARAVGLCVVAALLGFAIRGGALAWWARGSGVRTVPVARALTAASAPLASVSSAHSFAPEALPGWAKVSRAQTDYAGGARLPVAFDLDLGGETALRMVLIQPGEFTMGSPANEEGRDEDEGPPHTVKITKPFYMGLHEITRRQWRHVMTGSESDSGSDDEPMGAVTYADAVEFCRKVGAQTGLQIRLPTEAEWEYACRAGTTTPFSFGTTLTTAQANYDGSVAYGGGARSAYDPRPTGAGTFEPNAWGLYDLHGNVSEWCADWYAAGFYAISPGADPRGPPTGTCRVKRGGSWGTPPQAERSANRMKQIPSEPQPDGFVGYEETRLLAGTARRHRGRQVDQPLRIRREPAHDLKRGGRVLLPNRDVAV